MKKLISFFCTVLLIWGCNNQKPVEKTIIGMFTPYTYFPETINKKVKEVKETNYFPVVKEGKIEAGTPLTAADRDSIGWTGDFIVQFGESGLAEKVSDLNENGEKTADWIIENNSVYYTNAKRMVNDEVTFLDKIKKLDDNVYQFEVFNPQTDTLINKVEVKLGDDNMYEYVQWYNLKGEPTTKYTYTYDPAGQMTGFTYSRNDTIRGGMNFTQNDNGFCKTQETYNKTRGTSELYSYEYEYDDAGNWIKNVAYKNDKPVVVSLREYTY